MKEWTVPQIKQELHSRSETTPDGRKSYKLDDLEAVVLDPRFPKRTADEYIEKIRELVESQKANRQPVMQLPRAV